jgi:geranylgeranyl pyrophosphate synthase
VKAKGNDPMTAPLQLIPLLEPIRPDLQRVVRLLQEEAAVVEEPLGSRLRSALDGGKLLRSALVVLGGRVLGAPIEPFYTLAAAVEVLHTATLIHDDMVDGASIRRGRETIHTTWPVGATVLAGDYLLARSAALVAELERPRLLGIFADMLCTVCAGEIRQMFATPEERRSRDTYYRHIEAKTASLCAAGMQMAGILGDAGELGVTAMRRFGLEFGLAFQITDDVLDLTMDEAQLGKSAGSDLRQGLVTLPTLYYLEQVEDNVAVTAVLSGRRDEGSLRAAVAAVRASGAIEAALAEARAHARQSQEALLALPENDSRHTLHALAEFAVDRRR